MESYQHDLYLIDVYDTLSVENGTLKIDDEYYPIYAIRSLVLYGQYSLSMPVLSLLSKHGILCHCFNYYGMYLGTYYPTDCRNVSRLLMCQYELASNEKALLKFQKLAVKEFCKTGQSLLRYYKRKGYDVEIPDMVVHTIPRIMEAHNKQLYYASFHQITMGLDYPFEKRSYRPPHNVVNSLMSFFNALLYKDILNSLYRSGLDPKISFTHAVNNRRAHALEYDLADFIRPVLVDRLIINLLKKGKVREDMFDVQKGYYLKPQYVREFIQHYQLFMQKDYGYTLGKVSGYQLINIHITQLQNYLKERVDMKGARLQ